MTFGQNIPTDSILRYPQGNFEFSAGEASTKKSLVPTDRLSFCLVQETTNRSP